MDMVNEFIGAEQVIESEWFMYAQERLTAIYKELMTKPPTDRRKVLEATEDVVVRYIARMSRTAFLDKSTKFSKVISLMIKLQAEQDTEEPKM